MSEDDPDLTERLNTLRTEWFLENTEEFRLLGEAIEEINGLREELEDLQRSIASSGPERYL